MGTLQIASGGTEVMQGRDFDRAPGAWHGGELHQDRVECCEAETVGGDHTQQGLQPAVPRLAR